MDKYFRAKSTLEINMLRHNFNTICFRALRIVDEYCRNKRKNINSQNSEMWKIYFRSIFFKESLF